MPVEIQGKVGPATLGDGSLADPRLGKAAEVIVQEFHGRFYEQTYRGNVFSGGMGLTAINNVTFTTGTLGATVTPVCGVWNPANSPVNLVILQAVLGVTVTAGTATGGAPFAWAMSTGNAVVSTGNQPLNRKTLLLAGSQAKDLTNVAPTGLTNNLVVRMGSALLGGLIKSVSSVETAVGQNIGIAGISVENLDGSLIVPPGGVLALLATTTPVAHSAASALLWEEVPL
jgi:hypothetical protein